MVGTMEENASISKSNGKRPSPNSFLYPSNSQPTFVLDDLDKKLLQELQDNFPLVQHPWLSISELLGISENEVLFRLERLTKEGVIDRIGAVLDSAKIGLTAATLVALQVPEKEVEAVAQVINEYPNISHNYLRENQYNIWFTISAPTMQEVDHTLFDIIRRTGIARSDILNLPTEQRFKINVRFQLT
jgi:siroheme decarboxylase